MYIYAAPCIIIPQNKLATNAQTIKGDKMKERIIVLTGGGTGGHVMPNISLLPNLKKHFDKIYYIGTSGIEKELTIGKVDKFFEIKACKLRRDKKLANLLLLVKLFRSIKESKKINQNLNKRKKVFLKIKIK